MSDRTYFEKQRDALLADISVNMENVLANMNALNRSLENVISVGKEFDTVGELWSKFYQDIKQPEPQTSNNNKE